MMHTTTATTQSRAAEPNAVVPSSRPDPTLDVSFGVERTDSKSESSHSAMSHARRGYASIDLLADVVSVGLATGIGCYLGLGLPVSLGIAVGTNLLCKAIFPRKSETAESDG